VLGQSHADPQRLRQAVAGHRAHDDAGAQQTLVQIGRIGHPEGDEIAHRGNVRQVKRRKPRRQLREASAVDGHRRGQMVGIGQRGPRRGEPQAVDIERLAQAVQQIRQGGMAHPIAHPQGGQPIGLREGAGYQQIGIARQQPATVGITCFLYIFEIGLIQHHHDLGWHGAQEILQRVPVDPGAGGVVGIGDKDHGCVAIHPFRHGRQIVSAGLRGIGGQGGRHPRFGPHRTRRQGIDGEGMGRHHRIAPRRKECLSHQIEQVVRAIPQGHLSRCHIQMTGQRLLQGMTAAVGIQGQAVQFSLNDPAHARRGTQRAFVGRQLDDVGNPQLPFQLLDRLARLVGRQIADSRQGLRQEIGIGVHGCLCLAHILPAISRRPPDRTPGA